MRRILPCARIRRRSTGKENRSRLSCWMYGMAKVLNSCTTKSLFVILVQDLIWACLTCHSHNGSEHLSVLGCSQELSGAGQLEATAYELDLKPADCFTDLRFGLCLHLLHSLKERIA